MSEVQITVRGSHTAYAAPERATVHLRVDADGPDGERVVHEVADVTTAVRDSIKSLHEPDTGPVTWWANDQLQTWANRPWSQDGTQLPLVHHARTSFEVKFSDFTALSGWIARVAGLPRTTIVGIDWALTARRRDELTGSVRSAAVADARAKAEVYAAALGLEHVTASAVADAGMLAGGLHPGGAAAGTFARAAAPRGGAEGQVEFEPQQVSITCEVDARFLAT
jgi:uncharacterized protein YggE